MELIPNSTFRVVDAPSDHQALKPGVYRVVLAEIKADLVCVALVLDEAERTAIAVGRPKKADSDLKRPRKVAPPPLIGKLLWMERSDLLQMEKRGHLVPFTVPPRQIEFDPTDQSIRNKLYASTTEKMRLFLDLKSLQESILLHRTIGPLVSETVVLHKVSRSYVYKHWSKLLRWGFHETSLYPDLRLCGAPGKPRPCGPADGTKASRKKAGRKSLNESIARDFGVTIDPVQPGMTSMWTALVRAADASIPNPKPRWSDRHRQIVTSGFIGQASEIDGKFSLVMPKLGEYPNLIQVKHALTFEKTRLQRLIEKTTKRHFKSQLRGLRGRSWQGVSGPGHTWAIDSTVGDIYLRSSINAAWIIGRPIVYVIVDVWSTAVVGFYVCLTGPSWHTAKVALFNASANPGLIQRIYDYSPIGSMLPIASLCHLLLCDRGEYLSRGQRQTALNLSYDAAFTPPYRGDLKGLVEVLHRIEKDAQFLFVPGAIDYRREEMELRKVNPNSATMTLQNYVAFLSELFAEYNFTADRRHRLDADMIAASVFPSPAGLWQYGHGVGIAFRREMDQDILMKELLPASTARVSRTGIRFADNYFVNAETDAFGWSESARNFGGWDLPCHYHPGSMRSIWSPRPGSGELLQLDLSSESRAHQHNYFDEWLDAATLVARNKPEADHQRLELSIRSKERMQKILEGAQKNTEEAIKKSSGSHPTFTEARLMEVAQLEQPGKTEAQTRDYLREEQADRHDAMMAELLKGTGL
jgi:putative transposase